MKADIMTRSRTFVASPRDTDAPHFVMACAAAAMVILSSLVWAQPQRQLFPLVDATGLRLHNVSVVPATLAGKQGVRMTMAETTRQRIQAMTPEERQRVMATGSVDEQLATLEGVQFGNGRIEAEIAGAPAAGAGEGARGFVGIAFRVQGDLRSYDAFYLRPQRAGRRSGPPQSLSPVHLAP